MLLLSQPLRHITLLMGRRLQLREHHIEALHETDLFCLQLLQLVSQARVGVVDLPLHAEVVLVGLGARRQSRVHDVARVRSIPQRSFLTWVDRGK